MNGNKKPPAAVLGGDGRSRMLAAALALKGFDTVDIPFDTGNDTVPDDRRVIILPLPVTRDGIHLNCAGADTDLVDIINKLPPDAFVLGGCISERVGDMLERSGHRFADYYESEDLLRKNAYLTAESTLSLVMNETLRAVKGSRILVVGCGRCGRAAAKLFKRMGARVTVTSRKKRDRLRTVIMGMKSARTADIRRYIGNFDVVINTVPAPVITREELKNADPLALIVEIATGSAGVDMRAAEELGIRAVYAPGLPGKCVPQSAALVLRDAVIDIISECPAFNKSQP